MTKNCGNNNQHSQASWWISKVILRLAHLLPMLVAILLVGGLVTACATDTGAKGPTLETTPSPQKPESSDSQTTDSQTTDSQTTDESTPQETEFDSQDASSLEGSFYIPEEKLPRRLAIPMPIAVKDAKIDPQLSSLIRGVVGNYMVGKGYRLVNSGAVNNCAEKNPHQPGKHTHFSKQMLHCLTTSGEETDGVLLVRVLEFSDLNIGFVKNFSLKAEMRLFNQKAKLLGIWEDESASRDASLALDPLSAVFTLVKTAVVNESGVRRNNLVFDWAFNITSRLPGFSGDVDLPNILRVVTNVTENTFKLGDQIAVGVEGDRGLKAVFDLGEFRKGITLTEKQPGIYQGAYVIQEGDRLNRAQITVHLINPKGGEREWIEMQPLVTIDGIPPATPSDLKWAVDDDGMVLSWNSLDADLSGFLVQRSTNPLDGYVEVGHVAHFEWRDTTAQKGETWFYRVFSEDQAGNLSNEPASTGKATLPLTGEILLEMEAKGHLAAGVYRLEGETVVPSGSSLEFEPGSVIQAGPKGHLIIKGTLSGKDLVFRPRPPGEENKDKEPVAVETTETTDKEPVAVETTETTDTNPIKEENAEKSTTQPEKPARWLGVRVADGGHLILDKAVFQGCDNCLEIVGGDVHIIQGTWHNGNIGLFLNSFREVLIEKSRFQSLTTAIHLNSGVLSLSKSTITRNPLGIHVTGGSLKLTDSNLYDNDLNLKTTIPIILENNYLGSLIPNTIKVEGEVTIRSLLDGLWPGGQNHIIDPEALAKRGADEKKLGLDAFKIRNYGKAYEHLKTSLDYQEDKEVRLSLAFVLNGLSKTEELETLLEEGILSYPNEVRFFNLGIRNLLFSGRKQEARTLLQKALILNPGNAMLEGLKFMVAE